MQRFLLILAIFSFAGSLRAEEKIDFNRDVRPILSNTCFKCHGPAAKEGGLRLDTVEGSLKRKAIVPGKPHESKILQRILATEEDDRMPPAEVGERLKPAQVEILKKWIAQGAEYSPHWAFQKPKVGPLPALKNQGWVQNPIDRFILAKLEKEGVQPSPSADRSTLIRRLTLDLLGLLPTPLETADFVNDKNPNAIEKLVDRLLASPHYGERMARPWLDLARYADSNGYTIDGKRSIWPWRDWVIKAINDDMPFDRFTIEQLAGDMLPNPTRDQLVATGFHRNTMFNEEGGTNPEQFRVERTVDRTNTTGTVWLGLTVGCAQCHDHKYDPISQKEYYQLYAFFNSTEEPKTAMPTAEQEARMKDLNRQLEEAKNEGSRKPKTTEEVAKLLTELEGESHGGWQVLYPKTATSENGAILSALEDRSVLATGKASDADSYTVQTVALETGTLTALRLEALTHASLPKNGPGRAAGNFVLSQLVFETDGIPFRFRKASADFSQKGYDISDVLKNDSAKGWGVKSASSEDRNVDREAIFFLNKPHPVREGQAFTFTLRFSQLPRSGALGRFRLSATFASDRVLELPFEVQKVVHQEPAQRTPQDMVAVLKALQKISVGSERVVKLLKEIKDLEASYTSSLTLRTTPKARPTHIQKRGDFLDLGDAVNPGTLAVLHPLPIKSQPSRLDLAKWLVSPANSLTPRVVMNRTWQLYFGKGLVDTENDFGLQGSLPTHPELLDWLGQEFIRQGMSMKKMHKLIATSAVYQQSSKVRPDLKDRDADNKWLARQHRLRFEAEVIRDAALSASGLFTPKIGGPGVYPPQPPEIYAFTQNRAVWPESKGPDRFRRGLYTYVQRQCQHPLLSTFDAPDAQTSCTRRNRSNTPLQALHLANDPTFMEIAQGLGERIAKEKLADDGARIDFAFQLCFSRQPSLAERARLLQFLGQQKEIKSEQAWTMVARALLNLDEFITRE